MSETKRELMTAAATRHLLAAMVANVEQSQDLQRLLVCVTDAEIIGRVESIMADLDSLRKAILAAS